MEDRKRHFCINGNPAQTDIAVAIDGLIGFLSGYFNPTGHRHSGLFGFLFHISILHSFMHKKPYTPAERA